MPEVHYRTCSLCEAMCGLVIEHQNGHVTSIKGDAQDPFSRGFFCPKGVALQDLHEDPDRLRRPLRRTAGGWQEIGWEEALGEAADGLRAVQRAHGRNAVATYLGNPSVHDYGAMIFLPLLWRALGTRSRFSATSVDQLPHQLAALLMFGHSFLVPIPDVDRTDYFLLLGGNPIASGGSMMTAAGMGERLAALRARGGTFVLVDPRRTETARAADEHLFIRPGTDAFFLLALLRELLELGPKLGRLEAFTDGLEALRQASRATTPELAADRTGIPAETIRRVARELHGAGSAVCHGRVGTSTQAFGGLCNWLIVAINAVTGNLDRPGGALFTAPAFDFVGGPRALRIGKGGFGRSVSRVRGLPEFGGELPVAALAEEILTPGEGRIRALVTFAGNPVLSTPNGRRLDAALASLDFMVSIDPYLNETTRHARLILPPTTPLERGHYDLVFHALAVRNTARYSPPLFPRPEGALHDWEILLELKKRLGRGVGAALQARLLEALGPEGLLDIGLRLGPRKLSLAKLRRAPHGLDLGPLEPSLPGRLATPDKRIRLAPEPFLEDLARLHASAPANGTLLLIGRRNVRDNNSWMHNLPRLMRGKTRCTLMVHPEDAAARGLVDGAGAEVISRVGSVRIPVSVTDEVMRGVVSLPHGYGHARQGVRLGVAAANAGASLNDVTDEELVDALCGTAAFSGVLVEVRAG